MTLRQRVLLFLAVMGPGIITANIDNDASGITTYSVAGARFGYALLWTIIPTTVCLIVIQEMIARLGVVTGKGLADLIRERFGVKITFLMMLGLLITNVGTTVANFAGLAASSEILGMSKYVIVPLGAFTIWILVTRGTYRSVERILLVACLAYSGYIVSGVMATPDWPTVAQSMVIPRAQWNPEFIMLSVAIIGTTITPWMQFYMQSSIVEKGLTVNDFAATRTDVVIGCIFTQIIAFFVIVTCGTLLFPHGLRVSEAHEAALALRPLAGDYAYLIFSLCLANASLLGAIIVPLATSYYICEAMGWEAGVNKSFTAAPQFMWIYTLIIGIAALVVLIPGAPLVFLMVLASVLNGLLLPVVLVFINLLINDDRLMGMYTNPAGYNYISWGTAGVLSVLSILLLISYVAEIW